MMQTIITGLNETCGCFWVIFLIIVGTGLIDTVTGGFIKNSFLELLYLDEYFTLKEKYSDPDRDLLRKERYAAYDNYSLIIQKLFKQHRIKDAWKLRRIYKQHDYLTLFHMERALMGDKKSQEWLER